MVGHVKDGGTLGKLQQVALGREDIDLIVVKVQFKLVHSFHATGVLQHLSDTV